MTVTERRIEQLFPDEETYQSLLKGRKRRGGFAHLIFLLALTTAVIALATLLYTIINDSFGLTAVVNQTEPEAVVASLGYDPATTSLEELSAEELVDALAGGISNNVGRRLEREQRFFNDRLVFESPEKWAEVCASVDAPPGCTSTARDKSGIVQLVYERVVVPDVIATFELVPSLLRPDDFTEEMRTVFQTSPERFPDYTFDQVQFEFRAWLNPSFITTPASATPETTGIRTAILGSIWLVLITVAFAVPVGVGAAVYLEEFAKPTKLNDFIQTNINNLAGVPSIVYGMLGLAILVRALEPLTSGAIFGDYGDNGRTILSAGVTLGLLTLPVVIISSQEAIRAVPNSLRQAGMALGATRWQTVRSQILPVAVPGILTGTILAIARAVGETAPLIMVGAASFITSDPTGPFSKFTALPIQIFQWTALPQVEFRHIAAAASLALLVLLLVLNATAVLLRNRYSRRI